MTRTSWLILVVLIVAIFGFSAGMEIVSILATIGCVYGSICAILACVQAFRMGDIANGVKWLLISGVVIWIWIKILF